MLPYLEQINTQWNLRPPDARLCGHIALFSQTITRAAVTYKRNRLMDHWAEREARQRTASVFTDLGSTQTRRRGGRLVVCRGEREGECGGCMIALTFSVDPGLSRSSSLHKTTPSFREVCKKASGSEMVFFGDSSTPSVINHVTVCSAEFMSSHNRSYSTKRLCLVSQQLAAPVTLSSVR